MFKKTSTKIVLGIVAITTVVLIAVTFVIFYRTNDEFKNVITAYGVSEDGTTQKVQYLIPDTSIYDKPPFPRIQKSFSDKFSFALFTGGFIGVLLSLIAGSFFSRIITRPLDHLKSGMQKLRINNKKVILEHTGEEEFDDVISLILASDM